MGFVTIKDQGGVEHLIHTSQLPVLNQQCSPSYACPECDNLRADLAAAQRELAAWRRATGEANDAIKPSHSAPVWIERRVAELLAQEGGK